eukprot:6803464-Pyramimonas_sp.AAC.1
MQEEGKEELKELIESLNDTQPAGPLVAKCRTIDQAKAVVTFLDAASEKTLRSTVALTASRGRGKSAALGESQSERVITHVQSSLRAHSFGTPSSRNLNRRSFRALSAPC